MKKVTFLFFVLAIVFSFFHDVRGADTENKPDQTTTVEDSEENATGDKEKDSSDSDQKVSDTKEYKREMKGLWQEWRYYYYEEIPKWKSFLSFIFLDEDTESLRSIVKTLQSITGEKVEFVNSLSNKELHKAYIHQILLILDKLEHEKDEIEDTIRSGIRLQLIEDGVPDEELNKKTEQLVYKGSKKIEAEWKKDMRRAENRSARDINNAIRAQNVAGRKQARSSALAKQWNDFMERSRLGR